MERIDKIQLIRAIVVVGFICAVIFHYVEGIYFAKKYPYTSFLYTPGEQFDDFLANYYGSITLNPYYSNPFCVNLPFTFVMTYPFTIFKPYVAGALQVLLAVGGLLAVLWRTVPIANIYERMFTIFSLVIASYPILFTFDRGNYEFIVFVFIGLFVILFKSGRYNIAAMCLACAIAIKIYPAVFILLFILNRKWKQCFMTAGFTLFLTIGSAALLRGGVFVTIAGLQNNLSFFKGYFLDTPHGLRHGSSMNVPFTMLLDMTGYLGLLETYKKIYPVIAMVIFLCVTLYIKLVNMYLWKIVSLLTFMIILLPQVSYDYKLIHIFLPVILFASESNKSKLDRLYAVIFGLLLIPKDYYYFLHNISINGMINVLLMFMFIALIAYEQATLKTYSP